MLKGLGYATIAQSFVDHAIVERYQAFVKKDKAYPYVVIYINGAFFSVIKLRNKFIKKKNHKL